MSDTQMLEQLNAKLDRLLSQNDKVLAQNASLLDQNHAMLCQLQRAESPVDLVDTDEAARRAGVSVKTLRRLAAGGVFSDGRPPEKRRLQCPRRWYADEVTVYRSEGADGVRRLRETLGRD